MKHLLALTAATAVLTATSALAQSKPMPVSVGEERKVDLSTPEGAVLAQRKIGCSTIDGKDVTYHWEGRAYSRRMGERDQHLFDVEGMNVRSCTTVTDPERGPGYKLVSREILLYLDKDTGEVLRTWENPWSGETVEVQHVANDPVNFGGHVRGRDGQPTTTTIRTEGGKYFQTNTVPLFYPNPLGGDYQAEVGGTYHATEMFNFMGDADSLLSPNTDTAEAYVGWVRMSDWLPWMKMRGRDGVIYFHTAGRKRDSWDELSDRMKTEIRTNYPIYTTAPPDDDPRPNMTSWKDYKRIQEAKRAE